LDAGETPEVHDPLVEVLEEYAGRPLVDQMDGTMMLASFMEEYAHKRLPPGVAEKVLGQARVEELRAGVEALLDGPKAPPGRTVQENVNNWLVTQQAQVASGQMTPGRYQTVAGQMAHVLGYLGAASNVEALDAEKVAGFYGYALEQVSSQRWSRAYARETFSTARRWVRWLWEMGKIELPRNINSRSFRFGSPVKSIRTWTPEEVSKVLAAARPKMKLILLLMLNTGATQQDVSDLLDTEVNWREGRIVRKRSKTGDHDSTPVVNYKLWPQTFAVLKRFRSGGEHVLTTRTGKPYLRQALVAGKVTRSDIVAAYYYKLKKKIGFKKPLKLLRKTGASLLESHEAYGRFVGHYLGHAPKSMAERHYAAPAQALFDEAILWLGRQLSQMS
jgi:integrase